MPLKENFQKTASVSHFKRMVPRLSVQKEYLTGKNRMIHPRIFEKHLRVSFQREILLRAEIGMRRVQRIRHNIN